MARRRRQGRIAEWHDDAMDGTIRGDDGVTYFVRCSSIVTREMLPYSGRYVTFVPSPREQPGRQDHEAYEVEIVGNSILTGVSPPRPSRKDVTSILSKLKEGIDQWEGTASRDALWDEIAVVERYPEARTNLEQTANAFGLRLLPNSPYIVAYADPEAYLVDAGGTFGGWFRGTVPFKRPSGGKVPLGSYVTLGDEELTLLLFVFTRPGYKKQTTDLCWRAYLIRDEDARLLHMPPKDDGSHNSYRQGDQGFLHLVSDIGQMIESLGYAL